MCSLAHWVLLRSTEWPDVRVNETFLGKVNKKNRIQLVGYFDLFKVNDGLINLEWL